MPQDRDTGLRFIAWPGLGLHVPDSWDVAELGKGYLRVEQTASPSPRTDGTPSTSRPWAEFRWERVRPPFSADKQIKRLAKAFPKVRFETAAHKNLGLGSTERTLSAKGLECTVFGWSVTSPNNSRTTASQQISTQMPPQETGHGLMAYSPAHELALVCQSNAPDEGPGMIGSVQLFGEDDEVPVEVFGLSAKVPGRFRLDDFSFKPGHFRLSFRSTERGWLGGEKRIPGTRIVLDRVGPASVALKSSSLADWMEAFQKELYLSPNLRLEDHEDRTAWLRPSRRAKKPACIVLARLDRDTNKILCVSARGKKLPDEAELRALDANYGTL